MDVLLEQTTLSGTVPVSGLVELPDAIALEAALAHGAAQLGALGSTETLDARRARAAGDLAREHLNLFAEPVPDAGRVVGTAADEQDPTGAGASTGRARVRASRRDLMLVVHVSDRVLAGCGSAACPSGVGGSGADRPLLGRVASTRTPVDVDAVHRWAGAARTRITVHPVLDLAEHLHVEQYEIPERLRRQAAWRDVGCVFPSCTRSAARARTPAGRVAGVDVDHITPDDRSRPERGGQTETSNLAPLCRHHHNLKTTARWSYVTTAPGVDEWTGPAGRRYRRDHRGTHPLPPEP